MKALAHTTALDPTRPVLPDPLLSRPGVLTLPQLLERHQTPPPSLIEPGLLPSSGILFLGGQPKIGKSILAVNLALALASGSSFAGFDIPTRRRVLICQCELPTHHFAHRLDIIRRPIGSAADAHLFVDTAAAGHLLSTSAGLDHFLDAARSVAADVIVLDPLYSTHDQDENDTRAMTALCQSLLRLRDASGAALIVVHHVRKSIARHEIGTAFRGSSALHAVGDSYLLLTPLPSPLHTLEVGFQLRYAAAPPPRLLSLNPETLWFEDCPSTPAAVPTRRKVESVDVQRALANSGPARFNQLRQRIMDQLACSRRTAQLAIQRACQQGSIVCTDGLYRLSS